MATVPETAHDHAWSRPFRPTNAIPAATGCRWPLWQRCTVCGEIRTLPCGRSSRRSCEWCSMRYRRRVRRVFASGHTDRPGERIFLLTLTAPGERAHGLPNGEWCPCTPIGGVELATWNASMGRRWSDFMTDLRRGLSRRGDVQYAKGVEVQDRGALHIHAVIRCGKDLSRNKGALRKLAIRHGFGHAIDVQAITSEAAARYVSKYVTEEVGQAGEMPWFRIDRRTGEVLEAPTYRKWSASRRWGLTMSAVRAAQRSWVLAQRGGAGGAQPAPPGAPEAPLDSSTQRSARLHAIAIVERVFGAVELV